MGKAALAGELRTVRASAERGQQTVWEAFGARAMKDADLEEQRACWDNRRTSQAGNAARTQQEYDDDESGATALMEGVGATAGGRFLSTAPGKKIRLGPQCAAAYRWKDRRWAAAAKPSCHFISGPGYKGRGPSYAKSGKKDRRRAYLPRSAGDVTHRVGPMPSRQYHSTPGGRTPTIVF